MGLLFVHLVSVPPGSWQACTAPGTPHVAQAILSNATSSSGSPGENGCANLLCCLCTVPASNAPWNGRVRSASQPRHKKKCRVLSSSTEPPCSTLRQTQRQTHRHTHSAASVPLPRAAAPPSNGHCCKHHITPCKKRRVFIGYIL